MTSLRAVASAPHDAAAVYNHVDMLCRIVLGGPETGGAFAWWRRGLPGAQ